MEDIRAPGNSHGLVSVLTPSFQYAEFIEDAIRSVLRQDGVSIQHIVQDGGSDDGTVQVLERFGSDIAWRSEPDDGQSDALNRALRRAGGDWIAWLNADEFYLPNGLGTLMDQAAAARADVVYGDTIFVDRDGRFMRLVPQHGFSPSILKSYGCYISTCSTIFRREILGNDPWDPAASRVMDWDLLLRLAEKRARFLHVPYPVGAFRVHEDRVTAQPATEVWDEYELVASRNGISRPWSVRQAGRVRHGVSKLLGGAYQRQIASRKLRGEDLTWMRSDAGVRTFKRLLVEAYGDDPIQVPWGAE